MAITGRFVADFSDFDRGVQGAGAKLLTFEGAADRAGGRLMDLGAKGQDASPKMGGFATSLKTVDGALASMGIHIGPEIRALGELGDASGRTASQLGLVTSAGFALAAGIGGWKIGRLIAEFTGTDKAIGDLVAHAMGWGDELQRAGAKADVLALASKNAGRAITDFGEAVKINADAAAAQSLAFGKTANAAHDTMVAVSGWQRELRAVRADGNLDQLTKDLASQDFTLKELSLKYGVSVGALENFQRSQKATAEAVKVTTAAHDAQAKSVRDYYNWVGERAIEHEKTIQTALAGEAAAYRAFNNEIGVLQMEQDARDLAHAAAAEAAIAGEGQALMEAAAAEHTARVAAAGLNEEVAKTAPIAGAASASMNDLANAMNASAGVIVGAAHAIEQAYNAAGIGQNNYFLSGTSRPPTQTSPPLPRFAAGGPVLQDGPIYAHAGEYVVPKGGGGSTTIINITQPLGTPTQIAAAVKQALTTAHMSGGGRMPA